MTNFKDAHDFESFKKERKAKGEGIGKEKKREHLKDSNPEWKTERDWGRKKMISTSLTPPSTDGTESACNVGDPGLIPESGTSLGEGNGTPL